MISKKNKRILKLIIGICSFILISPIIFIIYHFWNQQFSSEITDWGAFGDYIGGFINTIVSFISLLVLGYLTHLVSKETNEENRKTNILMRKLDAYNELTIYFPKINLVLSELPENIKIVRQSLGDTKSLSDPNFISKNSELMKNLKVLPEFHYFLHGYNVRFGHLFDYDFQGDNYQSLLNDSKEIKSYFQSVTTSLELSQTQITKIPDFESFFDKLVILINELKNELKT